VAGSNHLYLVSGYPYWISQSKKYRPIPNPPQYRPVLANTRYANTSIIRTLVAKQHYSVSLSHTTYLLNHVHTSQCTIGQNCFLQHKRFSAYSYTFLLLNFWTNFMCCTNFLTYFAYLWFTVWQCQSAILVITKLLLFACLLLFLLHVLLMHDVHYHSMVKKMLGNCLGISQSAHAASALPFQHQFSNFSKPAYCMLRRAKLCTLNYFC